MAHPLPTAQRFADRAIPQGAPGRVDYPREDRAERRATPVLTNALRSKGMARCAVFLLTVGLGTLAGLALWGTRRTAQTTARVRARAEGRSPLPSALSSAGPHLEWLAAHGDAGDADELATFRDTYGAYTDTLRQ